MKIISNFSDYYDSIQQYGIDTNIVFKRIHEGGLKFDQPKVWQQVFESQIDTTILNKIQSTSAIDICEPGVPKLASLLENAHIPSMQLITAYACINGRIYRNFILVELIDQGYNRYRIVDKHPTAEVVFAMMQEQIKNTANNKFWNDRIRRAKTVVDLVSDSAPMNMLWWSKRNHSKLTQEQVWDFHRQLDTPVFFKIDGVGIKHASLAYYGFNRLFDGNVEVIAQEISYCLGNVISNKNEPPLAISNELKIDQHGFDRKQSFRHRK